jgi:hypothetical protein
VNIFAYCAESMQGSMRKVAGPNLQMLITCPPHNDGNFELGWLEGWDLVFFKLHGAPDQPWWEGDDWNIALDDRQLEQVDFGGAVVFIENCWMADSFMLQALTGAKSVIGGEGINYGGLGSLAGADILGLYFRWAYEKGASPELALRYAKMRLAMRIPSLATRDAMAFRILKRDA